MSDPEKSLIPKSAVGLERRFSVVGHEEFNLHSKPRGDVAPLIRNAANPRMSFI